MRKKRNRPGAEGGFDRSREPHLKNRQRLRKIYEESGRVWLDALCDFENALHKHVEEAEDDQLRFQTERLFKSLNKRIKAVAVDREEWIALFGCYEFVTDTSRHFGFDEARRLHGEEMAARSLSSPRSFCSSILSKQFTLDRARFLHELLFRVGSIASWMEAQQTLSLWLVFKELRWAWRGNRDETARTLQAFYLSQLPQRCLVKTQHRGRGLLTARFPNGVRVGTNYDNKPWTDRQWGKILKQAARLTERSYNSTDLEKWVWWCYPVFRRYRWNTREVLNAASNREIDFGKEKPGIDKLITFQKYWIRRGLRFTGRKQKQSRTPPLAEFVRHIVVPDPEKMWGSLGGFLFLPKKN
jgi:hypothetical protein